MSNQKNYYNEGLHGYSFLNTVAISAATIGLASIPAEASTLPICAIRTNYIAAIKSSTKNVDTVARASYVPQIKIPQIARDIYQKRGLYGFFNASAPAITSQIISSASKYSFYEALKYHYGQPDDGFFKKALFGTISGVTGGLLTAPFDRMRALRQYNDGQITRSYQSIAKLFLSNPMEAWRGYGFSFGKNVVLYSLLYPGYDSVKTYTGGNPIVASLSSALVISGILQPIEFARTRHMLGQNWRLGWNPRPYYTGYTLSAGRAIPHFMITMCTMEYLKEKVENEYGVTIKKK